ncbi:MAG TPA: GIY-YIG nuclease family protein [Herpetosiphonaceae bacterium]|nr:GIY-YIG nuclease family protein [Herpetosiphonaceae bacterium]
MDTSRFYVYVLCRPDGRVFYVGKGLERRFRQHKWEAARGHRCHKCNVIRKIWRDGGQVRCYILLETDNEQEAFAYERELIALYGRENLVNLTDGGEGQSGKIVSHETRAKLSRANQRRYSDPSEREKTGLRNRLRFADPSVREKLSASIKASWQDPETRANRIAGLRSIGAAVAARENLSAKMSETNRQRWQDPEYRAKMSAAMKAQYDDPEFRARSRAALKAKWADPEARAAHSEKVRAGWARRKKRT